MWWPFASPAGKPAQSPAPEDLLAIVGDQHHLALHDPDELVLGGVPVALARPLAGRQAQQVDAELGQAGGVAEQQPLAPLAGRVIGRRIAGSGAAGGLGGIDPGHAGL